jgi:hypothetical protein
MSPRYRPSAKPFFIFLILSAMAVFAGCSEQETPESQVRSVIERMEVACFGRDLSGILEHVSKNYRDDYGNGREELGRIVRGYFIVNQSIHLLTRIEDLTFPAEDEARVKIVVAMVGRDAAASNAWNLAAELNTFDVVLVREDDEWKVTWARRQRG